MTFDFNYILDKIDRAHFTELPFRHIEIFDVFRHQDFRHIVQSTEICLKPASDDRALFEELFQSGYRIVDFPGAIEDFKEYIDWHLIKNSSQRTETTCEGFGVVLRLDSPATEYINRLERFLHSPEFIECLARKFGISVEECNYDGGIQKYLDGYEISPHSDIRRKALTYMININPDPRSEHKHHHTQYMQLKPQWRYVNEFWAGNTSYDRCWLPWNWCIPVKTQTRNNSMVIFSPGNDTLHAVKADYNHLVFQRTQLYGNLWYKKLNCIGKPTWEDLEIYPGVSKKISVIQ